MSVPGDLLWLVAPEHALAVTQNGRLHDYAGVKIFASREGAEAAARKQAEVQGWRVFLLRASIVESWPIERNIFSAKSGKAE